MTPVRDGRLLDLATLLELTLSLEYLLRLQDILFAALSTNILDDRTTYVLVFNLPVAWFTYGVTNVCDVDRTERTRRLEWRRDLRAEWHPPEL